MPWWRWSEGGTSDDLSSEVSSPGWMTPRDIGLPSYVLYGPSTFASSIEASRDAKYIVSNISYAKKEIVSKKGKWNNLRRTSGGGEKEWRGGIGLLDTFVELHGCGAFEGKAHASKGICETLHSDANGAVAEVRVLRLRSKVEGECRWWRIS